jgi:hypothetical protein
MSFEYDQNRTPGKRDSMWGVSLGERDGREDGSGQSKEDKSIMLMNGEEREFKPGPCARMEVEEEAVLGGG